MTVVGPNWLAHFLGEHSDQSICLPKPASLASQIRVMAHTHVALSPTLFGRSDSKRFGRSWETAPRQVFAEGSLND
jgi:hypothetical protein